MKGNPHIMSISSSSIHFSRKHTVPTHLNMPDHVLTLWSFNLTARQLLLLLIGAAMGGNLWHHIAFLGQYAIPGEILRAGCALLPFLLALFVACYHAAGRPLEVWLVVILRYWLQPRWYIWHSIRTCEDQLYPVYLEQDEYEVAGNGMTHAWHVRHAQKGAKA